MTECEIDFRLLIDLFKSFRFPIRYPTQIYQQRSSTRWNRLHDEKKKFHQDFMNRKKNCF